jgi:hypothetical protein
MSVLFSCMIVIHSLILPCPTIGGAIGLVRLANSVQPSTVSYLTLIMNRCYFAKNQAAASSVMVLNLATVNASNCLFDGNIAGSGAGGISAMNIVSTFWLVSKYLTTPIACVTIMDLMMT